VRFGLKLSQGATIEEYREVWRIADEAGFDHFWNMDHFASLGSDTTLDIFEAWTLLAAASEGTTRTRIGCMVSGNTYRHPGVLAKMAATVDHVSGGRLEFGLGAAWAENEHTMLGLQFGTVGERMDRFEEALHIIKSLWTEPTTTFDGKHYQIEEAIAEPKPVQKPYPPIWIGGSGRKRTLRLVAEHADVWNMAGSDPAEFTDLSGVLDRHCEDVGRDPAEIRRSVQLRPGEDVGQMLPIVEEFAGLGVTEFILITTGGTAESQATQAAELLPELRGVG
jgi:F420-dependent oxidoreductase-like protein